MPKQITCIRVDGSSDEGPSHLEVQFGGQNITLLKKIISLWFQLVVVEQVICTE